MKLIGIDLDGTLLNSNQSISQKNARTMKHLPGGCFPFIYSGREIEDISNILKKSGLRIPTVGLDGSVRFDGEKRIFESSFDKNDVKKIDSVLSKFPTKIYTNLRSYESRNYKNKMKKVFHEVESRLSIKKLDYELKCKKSICSILYNSTEEIIEKDATSIYKFFIFTPNHRLKTNIFNHLKEMLNVFVTESAPVNIEVIPQNVSKSVVSDRLESIYNLRKPLRITIRDSLGGLSMLEGADISFTVESSRQEIMKKADYVTVSNDKDGVSQTSERILTI